MDIRLGGNPTHDGGPFCHPVREGGLTIRRDPGVTENCHVYLQRFRPP
jgi:hypothetical protein